MAFVACLKRKWEAGSLGQVRQVPLNPCRESRREHSHCKTQEVLSPVSPSGSGVVCWLLFEILRSAMLSRPDFPADETIGNAGKEVLKIGMIYMFGSLRFQC